MKSVLTIAAVLSIFAAPSTWAYTFSNSDQQWIDSTAAVAIEDLRQVGATMLCAWGNDDKVSLYMSALFRIVLKAVPSTVSAPALTYSNLRTCVTLNAIKQ